MSSFQQEVKQMYRHFMKTIYKKPELNRLDILYKVRSDFKKWSKIPRKDFDSIDYAFNTAQRQLIELKQSNIVYFSVYTPKKPN